MKKFMLFLLIAFLMPQLSFSQGQCHFSAQVYSQDPCCIVIDAGCGDPTAWTVVVDGSTTYDFTDYNANNEIVVCYTANGSHVVEFFVNGSLWWSRTVDITDCEDPDPGQCYFSAQVSSQDPCCIVIDAGCEADNAWTVVVDGTTTYDFTDYNANNEILHCYTENGSHVVEFFVNGVLWWTRTVDITDCEDPDPGQCYFSAQVSSQDPCCIVIDAGCEADNAWTVVVDGTTTYDFTDYNANNEILDCYTENGTHVVEFFVNGVLWWTRTVDITDCEDPDPGQCYFSAQVSSQDPCCIVIDAGCEADNAWTVVVDGTTTYDFTDYNANNEILVCYEKDGVHSVEFFVNGVLWWTRIVEITDCKDTPPGQCHFSAQVYSEDPCCIIIDAGCEDNCAWTVVVDGTTTYDHTDYDANNEIVLCYEENGVHTVDFYVNGVLWWTRDVELTDCREEEPCCEIDIHDIRYISNPFNPCQIIIFFDTKIYGGEECLEGAVTTYDYGDGEIGTGSSHTYDGSGPWVVCVTITKDDCVYNACETFILDGCDGAHGGDGSGRNADPEDVFGKSINIFPNPTTDYVNLAIDQSMIDPPTQVKVMDVSGKLVYQQDLTGQSTLAIDLSAAPDGLFIVQLSNQNGIVATERLVKTK